jgi:hypothetical protein
MQESLHLAIAAESKVGTDRIPRAVRTLNERYADVLFSPWTLEGRRCTAIAQASPLARSAARLTEMTFELLLRAHPQPVTLGFGLAAGPAPAHARAQDALESAARQRLSLQASGFDEISGELGLSQAVSGSWCAVGALTRNWTERQAQFVRWVLRDGVLDWRRDPPRFVPERRRKEAAQAFGVSPSVVTESLQAAEVGAFRYGVWSAAWQLAAALRAYRSTASASSSSMMRS